MKKVTLLLVSLITIVLLSSNSGCESTPNSDQVLQKQTEQITQEANRQLGMPAIVNFQEKKNLKWIYELCDQEDLICYAYLFVEMTGELKFIGKCIGYGIPYSTQYSNPEKISEKDVYGTGWENLIIQQAEPNGLFKPVGLSATWLIMLDPKTNKPRPVYIEPSIIVSPFKLD